MSRFVQIKPGALFDLVTKYRLDPTDSWLLTCLILEADHTTGIWHGTQKDVGELVGLDRRNVRARLHRLDEARVIESHFQQGRQGHVVVWAYLDLVHMAPSKGTNHPLQKGRLGDLCPDGQKGRIIPSSVQNRPFWNDESPGQRVDPSCLAAAALPEPFAAPVQDDEGSARARVIAENVFLIHRGRVTVSPGGDDQPGRAATPSPRAALNDNPSPHGCLVQAAVPLVGRGSAGGGSEATPVHPRSRNASVTTSVADVSHLRDPRATGPDFSTTNTHRRAQ